MVFVGEAVVEVRVGEGLGGHSGLLTAILPLEVVLPQVNYIAAEVGEMQSEVGGQEGRQETQRGGEGLRATERTGNEVPLSTSSPFPTEASFQTIAPAQPPAPCHHLPSFRPVSAHDQC